MRITWCVCDFWTLTLPRESESPEQGVHLYSWIFYDLVIFWEVGLWLWLCCCSVAQSSPTLCDSMDCSPPGFSVLGISQSRILEWIAFSFSRVSPSPGYLPDAGIEPMSEPPGKRHWLAKHITCRLLIEKAVLYWLNKSGDIWATSEIKAKLITCYTSFPWVSSWPLISLKTGFLQMHYHFALGMERRAEVSFCESR